MVKKIGIWIGITQVLIFLSSLAVYKRIDLLTYTNVSFVYGAILILAALMGYVMKGRFFDVVFYSFQTFFNRVSDRDRRPLSELVPKNYFYPTVTGAITILLMLVTLMLYQV